MKIMSALIATQKNLEGGEERNLLQFNTKHRYQPHVVILAQKVAKQNRVKNAKVHKFQDK